ncbi:hypothetical protein ACWER9_18840, partial [Micromonospora sp. NPDC003944]
MSLTPPYPCAPAPGLRPRAPALTDEQTANVKAIIAATKKAGLPERAAVISKGNHPAPPLL